MNVSDAATLLTFAALGDNRTVTRETAMFWAEVLRPDITLDEGRHAVTAHFANSTDYLTPAHVNALVSQQREVRKAMVPEVIPPRELADYPEAGWRWTRVWQDAMITGHTEDRSREIANRQFGIDEDLTPLAIEAGEQVSMVANLARQLAASKPAPAKRAPIQRYPAQWAGDKGITVLDPDGWRNARKDFRSLCTEAEFDAMAVESTVEPFQRMTKPIPITDDNQEMSA